MDVWTTVYMHTLGGSMKLDKDMAVVRAFKQP